MQDLLEDGCIADRVKKTVIWYQLITQNEPKTIKLGQDSFQMSVMDFCTQILYQERLICGNIRAEDLTLVHGDLTLNINADPKSPDALVLQQTTINNPIVIHYP
jgi:hypothetical protein